MSGLYLVTYVLLWVVVVIQGVGVFALYHHFGQMYLNSRDGRAAQGPEIGTALRHLRLRDTRGTARSLPSSGRATILVFASTTCAVCESLRNEMKSVSVDDTTTGVFVICAGNEPAVQEWATGLSAAVTVIPDPRNRLAAQFGIGITPFLVAADSAGIVRMRGLVNDAGAIESVADELLETQTTGSPMREVGVG
jgi:hypothetical protein